MNLWWFHADGQLNSTTTHSHPLFKGRGRENLEGERKKKKVHSEGKDILIKEDGNTNKGHVEAKRK